MILISKGKKCIICDLCKAILACYNKPLNYSNWSKTKPGNTIEYEPKSQKFKNCLFVFGKSIVGLKLLRPCPKLLYFNYILAMIDILIIWFPWLNIENLKISWEGDFLRITKSKVEFGIAIFFDLHLLLLSSYKKMTPFHCQIPLSVI